MATRAERTWNRTVRHTNVTTIEFLDQSIAQSGHRPVDQFRAVISGNDFHAFRQRLLQARNLGLDPVNGLERIFLPARMTMTPPTASPLPSSSGCRDASPDQI